MKFVMNCLLVGLAVVALLQQTLASEEEYAAARDVCLERHGLSKDDLKDLESGKASGDIDNKIKCFTYCLLQEMDFLDAEGKLSEEKINANDDIGEEEKVKILECKAEHDMEEDNCEYSFKMMGCVVSKM